MMMYNLIESTIKQSIYNIYTTINESQLSFSQLSSFYRDLYKNYSYKDKKGKQLKNYSFGKILDITSKLTGEILNKTSVNFNRDSLHLSGNADLPTIKDIFEKHQIDLDVDNNQDYWSELDKIKRTRNSLAHGVTTFSKSVNDLSVDTVMNYSEDVIKFLNHVLECTDSFIKSKKFKEK